MPRTKRPIDAEPDPILAEIEVFLRTHDMSPSAFGIAAAGDWKLVKELRGTEQRGPRRLWPETAQNVRHWMLTYRPTAPQDAAA